MMRRHSPVLENNLHEEAGIQHDLGHGAGSILAAQSSMTAQLTRP